MATAKREGGLYLTDKGVAVDAEGRKVEGAPKATPDTDPSKQPGAAGAGPQAGVMTMRFDDESLRALGGKPAKAAAPADSGKDTKGSKADTAGDEDGGGEDDELPTIKDLPDAVARLKTVKEVKAMAKRDDRATAEKIYDARIAELEEK